MSKYKNNNTEEEDSIKLGYKDKFFCYKFENTYKYGELIQKLLKAKFTIAQIHMKDAQNPVIGVNDNFEEYLKAKNNEELHNLERKVNEFTKRNFKGNEEIAISISENNNTRYIYNNISKEKKSYGEKIKIPINSKLSNFIDKKINYTANLLVENSTYTHKNVSWFSQTFILEPIKIVYDDEYFVNIKVVIYSTGNIIIQYSIPLKNVSFKELYYGNRKLKCKCYVPENVVEKNNKYGYSPKEYAIDDAIELYNKLLIDILISKKDKKHINTCSFYNYTLIDYSKMPKDFKSMSNDSARNIYWLVNGPFGYFNERENQDYMKFKDNRYQISNYISLFLGTNGNSVIAYNNENPKQEKCGEILSNEELKYDMVMIYMNLAVEMLLIKKSFYNIMLTFKLNRDTSLAEIWKNYISILEINDFLFHITLGGYGSVRRLAEYLEENSIDFIPIKAIEENIERYKEMIQLKESKSKETKNYIVATIAMIYPIVFGIEAIDKMTTMIDKKLLNHNIIINLSNYNTRIWIFIILIITYIILKEKIMNFFTKVYRKLEFLYRTFIFDFNILLNKLKKRRNKKNFDNNFDIY